MKLILPFSLAIAFSIANPIADLQMTWGETKAATSEKKPEPKRLPWYSSPLEMQQSKAGTPTKNGDKQAASTKTASPNSSTKKTPAAQSIPSAVKPSSRPSVRQVAGPGSQNQQYQNGSEEYSPIQQQLDALYREKGLEAPVMSYDALPIQGSDDFQAMQAAQPQQAGAAPQNGYRVTPSQQSYNQPASNPQPTSWFHKIFGRRSKSNEQEQHPPAAPQNTPQYQGGQNQYQNGQLQNGQPQNGQFPGGQYQHNQPQNNQQQYTPTQQQQQYNQNSQNQAARTQQPQQTQTAQQPRTQKPAAQTRSGNGLDYSRLRQSRATQEPSAQQTRQVSQPRQQIEEEEPEESLDFPEVESTPSLQQNSQEFDDVESSEAAQEAPASTVRKRTPSPFDNLELHTPEEAAQEAPVAEEEGEVEMVEEGNNSEAGEAVPYDAKADENEFQNAQPGSNPLIVPDNGPVGPSAQPIIGIDDAELAAKYRILSAFPELKGMKGFCPVVLRDDRELIRSKRIYTVSYQNQSHQFSSSDAMLKFQQSPEKYLPVADGHDTVLLSENEAVVGTLDFAAWYRGRLYLFANLDNLETFVNRPALYERIALGNGAPVDTRNPAADEFEEPEESLEFENPVTNEEMESDEFQEPAIPANRSPADALRGPVRPPAGNRPQEKINVPPPPPESDDEDEIDMPGHQRPTAGLSQTKSWKPASRNLARR
ncbi:MAG: hypothetical protein KDA36_01435 [Planctomycetaceae bacterium]|nr:hypothetical protein [Planctomycetaceae bacterium]